MCACACVFVLCVCLCERVNSYRANRPSLLFKDKVWPHQHIKPNPNGMQRRTVCQLVWEQQPGLWLCFPTSFVPVPVRTSCAAVKLTNARSVARQSENLPTKGTTTELRWSLKVSPCPPSTIFHFTSDRAWVG